MTNNKVLAFLGTVLAGLILSLGMLSTLSASGEALVNRWGCGLEDNCQTGGIDAGWNHNLYVSEQTCCKAPNPANPSQQGGQAFKNGPVNGSGQQGQTSVSQQVFRLDERGIASADVYTVTFAAIIIAQANGASLTADLYGDAGHLATLLTYNLGDTPTDTSPYSGFSLYRGDPVVVTYSETYTLEVRTIYTGTTSTLGIKWTGLSAWFEAGQLATPTETPTETPTAEPEPTPTPTAASTPDAQYVPMVMGETAVLECLSGVIVATETGSNEIEVSCQ